MTSRWKQRLLPPLIILGAGIIAGGLIVLGEEAVKTPPEVTPTLVQAQTVIPEDTSVTVQATGTVQPAREVALVPQVAGRVVEISDNLVPGGRVQQGELLAMIEQRDYLAAHAQAQSQLRQAELELELERGRAATAQREWDILEAGGDAPSRSRLALREPHMEVARARLRAAQAAVRQAEGNLGRTRLKAPFNAVVVQENLDVGQVVGPAGAVAKLVGTDMLWVTVSVSITDLDKLDLPSGASPGSPAEVIQRLGNGKKVIHTGRLLRLAGQLDAQTRQAQVTVAVDRPFDPVDGAIPLLPGAYVEVRMQGRPVPAAFRIPRAALHSGDTVWLVVEDALAPRQVTVSGGDEQHVLISSGLNEADTLVTSPLSLPVEGQPVQIIAPRTDASNDAPEIQEGE